jgi:hypothetical protein
MPTAFSWDTPIAIATVFTTDLNGTTMTNGTYSAASTAIDNETDLYEYMDAELALASFTPTGTPSASLFLLPSLDGTNFVDGGGSTVPPNETLVGTVSLTTTASAKRRVFSRIIIPPFQFKLVVLNSAGVAFAASGNTLKIRRYNERSN